MNQNVYHNPKGDATNINSKFVAETTTVLTVLVRFKKKHFIPFMYSYISIKKQHKLQVFLWDQRGHCNNLGNAILILGYIQSIYTKYEPHTIKAVDNHGFPYFWSANIYLPKNRYQNTHFQGLTGILQRNLTACPRPNTRFPHHSRKFSVK